MLFLFTLSYLDWFSICIDEGEKEDFEESDRKLIDPKEEKSENKEPSNNVRVCTDGRGAGTLLV